MTFTIQRLQITLTALMIAGLTSGSVCQSHVSHASATTAARWYPIVDAGGSLFGSSSHGRWRDYNRSAHHVRAGEQFTLYSMTRKLGVMSGHKPVHCDDRCPHLWCVLDKTPEATVVAIAAPWNALPRIPHQENGKDSVYQKIVADELRKAGIGHSPVRIKQVLGCDLEGHGAVSYVIHAEYAAVGHAAVKGDYSMILVRRPVGHKFVTVKVAEVIVRKTSHEWLGTEYQLLGLYDLQHNGRLELIVRSYFSDGFADTIYDISNGHVKEALQTGCGF